MNHLAKENLQLVIVLVITHLNIRDVQRSMFCSYLSGATDLFKIFIFNWSGSLMAAYSSASAAQLLLQTHCLSSHQSLHGGTGTFCTLVARSDINKAHSVPTMVLYILQIQNDCCLINYCISLKFRHITEIIKWKSSKQKFFSFLLRAPRAR